MRSAPARRRARQTRERSYARRQCMCMSLLPVTDRTILRSVKTLPMACIGGRVTRPARTGGCSVVVGLSPGCQGVEGCRGVVEALSRRCRGVVEALSRRCRGVVEAVTTLSCCRVVEALSRLCQGVVEGLSVEVENVGRLVLSTKLLNGVSYRQVCTPTYRYLLSLSLSAFHHSVIQCSPLLSLFPLSLLD
jgi:hypothetical protein